MLVLNGYSRHNTGDWLLFEETLRVARRRHPGARVVGVALDPVSFSGRTGADEVLGCPVRPGNVARGVLEAAAALASGGRAGAPAFRAMRGAEAAYSVGGGFLQFRSPRELLAAGLAHGLQWAMARRAGLPVQMLPQSLGPFVGAPQRAVAGSLLRDVDRILVRDDASEGRVASLSPRLGGRTHVVPDLVFAAPRQPTGAAPADGPVGVVVRNWWFPGSRDPAAAEERYLGEVAKAIDTLTAEGRAVELVVHSDGPTARGDDRLATDRVLRRLARSVPVVSVCDAASPELAARAYRRYAVVISVRMHAALLALREGAASVAIGYEAKTHELFGQLGLADHVVPIETVTAGLLVELVRRPFPGDLVTRRWGALHDELRAELPAVVAA